MGELGSFYFLPIFAEYGLALALFSNGLSTDGRGMFETPVSYSLLSKSLFLTVSGAMFRMLGLILPIEVFPPGPAPVTPPVETPVVLLWY